MVRAKVGNGDCDEVMRAGYIATLYYNDTIVPVATDNCQGQGDIVSAAVKCQIMQ